MQKNSFPKTVMGAGFPSSLKFAPVRSASARTKAENRETDTRGFIELLFEYTELFIRNLMLKTYLFSKYFHLQYSLLPFFLKRVAEVRLSSAYSTTSCRAFLGVTFGKCVRLLQWPVFCF